MSTIDGRRKAWEIRNKGGSYVAPECVVIVRMPRDLRELLRTKARERNVSMNTLVANLLSEHLQGTEE